MSTEDVVRIVVKTTNGNSEQYEQGVVPPLLESQTTCIAGGLRKAPKRGLG